MQREQILARIVLPNRLMDQAAKEQRWAEIQEAGRHFIELDIAFFNRAITIKKIIVSVFCLVQYATLTVRGASSADWLVTICYQIGIVLACHLAACCALRYASGCLSANAHFCAILGAKWTPFHAVTQDELEKSFSAAIAWRGDEILGEFASYKERKIALGLTMKQCWLALRVRQEFIE